MAFAACQQLIWSGIYLITNNKTRLTIQNSRFVTGKNSKELELILITINDN